MTTEDDFQTALDANPSDWQTRLVLADFLEERGDPRAAGYRALGVQAVVVGFEKSTRSSLEWRFVRRSGFARAYPESIPEDWYAALRPANELPDWPATWWVYFATRRRAEDAAALAFARLPNERQRELLAAPTSPAESARKPQRRDS